MSRPKRILQVVGAMERAGIETWLMQVLRRLDRKRFSMDLLYNTAKKCAYDDEVRNLNYRIISCLGLPNPFKYAINFFKILKANGPYDIVHTQQYHFGGLHLRLAYSAGVPGRIMHSRNMAKAIPPSNIQKLTWPILDKWIHRYSTHLLAVSKSAAQGLYGSKVFQDKRLQILPSAIELDPFLFQPDREAIRRSLGFNKNNLIIGHIGRFAEAKNHHFIIDIFAILASKHPELRLILVGDGPLRQEIENKCKLLGLKEKILFTGVRSDVPQLLMGAMDVLLFPSKWEGAPRVLMESQAAGLPSIISDVISEESIMAQPLVRRLSLKESPLLWAQAVLEALKAPRSLAQSQALAMIRESPFNIDDNVRRLQEIYASIQ